jgi:WXG100 family type VII secretion target
MTEPLSQANYAAMATAVQQVQDAAGVINGLENQVDTHLTNLVSGWKGAASDRFAKLLEQWLLDFRDIRTQLETMVDKLGGTQKNYQVTEQDEQQGLNQLAGLLNHRHS